MHDLHATILHTLGIEHTRITYRSQGRAFRLTDVGGNAVKAPVDFYKAVTEVQSRGRRVALVRVKSNEATRFIAIPVG